MIGRITPDGTSTQFPIPTYFQDDGEEEPIQTLTVGPDGNVRYGQFVYPADSAVGRVLPDGRATSSLVPGHADDGIRSITAGPDGNVWFIPEFANGHYFVGRVTPDGQYALFETPGQNNVVWSIAAGPDGNLWATVNQQNPRAGQVISASIDQITPDGQFTEFPLADANHVAGSITVGPDGNLWFTEPRANQIGMMTLDGRVTEYQVPTPNSSPGFLTVGPDGNLWFTESGSGQIGEFVLGDGGSGGAAAATRSAGLSRAARAAAVDALFAGARPNPVTGVVVGRQPAVAFADAVFSAGRPEVLTLPPAAPAVADAGTMHHHQADRVEGAGAAGPADPLAAGLAEVL
jgi:virginiamycin B lyase